MKKTIGLIVLMFIINQNVHAQTLKGGRTLAWQVDMTENMNYDSAFSYASIGCAESIHIATSWSVLEPTLGTFNMAYINGILDVANLYFPANDIAVELQFSPVNVTNLDVPDDLTSTDFNDPVLIDRFKTALDTLFAHIPDLTLSLFNIGNESDIFFGTDEALYSNYKIFLDEVVPYVKSLYNDLHSTELNVGTTLTHGALTSDEKKDLCLMLNASLDVVSTTYYPLASNFTMRPPTDVFDDFSDLIDLYSDPAQPIYFVECGYSTSEVCNSSEEQQAEFYTNVFQAWDLHIENIKYLTIFKSTDWSSADVIEIGESFGLDDPIFLEYLRTLGVRTWEGDGTNKIAYEIILCELNARDWCLVECPLLSINTEDDFVELVLFPNPATDFLTIQSDRKILNVNFYSISGEHLFTSSDNIINIEELNSGTYFVQIELEDNIYVNRKIVRL